MDSLDVLRHTFSGLPQVMMFCKLILKMNTLYLFLLYTIYRDVTPVHKLQSSCCFLGSVFRCKYFTRMAIVYSKSVSAQVDSFHAKSQIPSRATIICTKSHRSLPSLCFGRSIGNLHLWAPRVCASHFSTIFPPKRSTNIFGPSQHGCLQCQLICHGPEKFQ